MGRPPLGNKPTQVRLPPDDMARVDTLVGKSRRAEFIRQAVAEKLARDEKG